jgi:predicted RecB family nuclease
MYGSVTGMGTLSWTTGDKVPTGQPPPVRWATRKTKAHLKPAGHQGNKSDYEVLLAANRQDVRQQAIDKILAKHPEEQVARDIPLTAAALRAGPPIVLDATLEDDIVSLRFDGLKKVDGPSMLGDFHYVPMLFHEGRKIGKEQRILMKLLGLLLSQVQGRLPAIGVVWHGPECRAAKVRLSPDVRKTERLLREVKEMVGPGSSPSLLLNDHCPVCEYGQRCHDQAVQEDNLTLLREMGEKEVRAYRQKGMFTITQLSYTFRYRKPRKRAKQHDHPHYHSLQARSIRTGTVHVHGRPSLPRADIKAYLDIEGIPDRDLYYLIGVVVESGESISHHYFWANEETEQDASFIQFLVRWTPLSRPKKGERVSRS